MKLATLTLVLASSRLLLAEPLWPGYAWGENIGWIRLSAGEEPKPQAENDFLSGFIWAESVGWIHLGDGSPADGIHYANDSASDYGVNREGYALSGYAWGENMGWIDFAPQASPGVRILPDNRILGAAWSDAAGWIIFYQARALGQLKPRILVAPEQGLSGQEVEIRFEVENLSDEDIPSAWVDGIYLSEDVLFDGGDRLLSRAIHDGGLAARGIYEVQATVLLPGAIPGPWHLLVVSDIFDDIDESDGEGDNVASSSIALDMTELPIGQSRTVALSAEHPEAWFKLRLPPGEPAGKPGVITLEDPDGADANALYLRWGGLPSAWEHDLAADARDQAGQRLLVPYFQDEFAYLLIVATRIAGASSDVTALAMLLDLALGKVSAEFSGQGGTGRLDMAISGAGFMDSTIFHLEKSGGGATIDTSDKVIVSPERAEVAFQLSAAPTGTYDLKAENPGAIEATLEGAFEVIPTLRGPILEAELISPDRYRSDRLVRLILRYSNSGDEEMSAPLFKVAGPVGTSLRLESDGEFQGNVIQVLGVHPEGVAGKLPPGGKGEIPILIQDPRDEGELPFQVFLFTPNRDDFVGWDTVERPEGMEAAQWQALWAPLSVKLGGSWIEYGKSLADLATRLARRGEDASSVRKLFRFAAREALGRPSSAVVGRVREAGTFLPLEGTTVVALQGGIVASSAVTEREGSFCLDWLRGAEGYDLQVVDHGAASSSVTMPAGGDLLNMDLLVTAGANGLSPQCPSCDEAGLPGKPLLPPDRLFSPIRDRNLTVISSDDPNEKDGPVGDLPADDEEISYQIFFENRPGASAWAQKVEVVDRLDSDLRPESFRFGGLRVGGTSISIDRSGQERMEESERVGLFIPSEGFGAGKDLDWMGPGGQWLLHISGEFDPAEGVARWTFETLDPQTGKPPDPTLYPDAGFLPPNDAEHRGDGSIAFTVGLKGDLQEDTEIANEAMITFDGTVAVVTNRWSNRIRRSLQAEVPYAPFPPSVTEHEVEVDVNLSWQSNGDSFDVYLWKEGESPALVAGKIPEKNFKPPLGLDLDTTYHWQVVAYMGAEESPGDVWDFKTVKPLPPPAKPENLDPSSGSVNVSLRPVLRWSQTPGASSYMVYLWRHGEARPESPVAWTGMNLYEVLGDLDTVATYDWQVAAVNGSGLNEGDPWSFRTAGRPFQRGDANADGALDLSDAVLCLFYLFLGSPEPPCVKSMDADNDGDKHLTDVIFILSYLYLEGAEPEEPFKACGIDEVEDSLSCRSYPPCNP